jgi:DNA-binding response OmpR family regulator
MRESSRRVLVIEDDLETGKQLVESLAANDYQADLAVNGNEGLRRGLATE